MAPTTTGLLAIRQSIAAGVNITYKILYNDAVAMTGGQPHRWPAFAAPIINQVRAEGVKIAVVTDEPDKYDGVPLPANVPVYHRESSTRFSANSVRRPAAR